MDSINENNTMKNVPRRYFMVLALLGLGMVTVIMMCTHHGHNQWMINMASQNQTIIGIGMGLTMRGLEHTTVEQMQNASVFFSEMLPSLCRTMSPGYTYKLYIGFDEDDPVLSTDKQDLFVSSCKATLKRHCHLPMMVNLVQCAHTRKPAWAQNDALMAAYKEGAQYLYMVNDDTVFNSTGWAETFIKALSQLQPKNVGLVGPTFGKGNMDILTYNFVHRTHIDIFGYFYPREFKDWYGDEWISRLYRPQNVVKVPTQFVDHTRTKGVRYDAHKMDCKIFPKVLKNSREILQNWIKSKGLDPGSLGAQIEYETEKDKTKCEMWRKQLEKWSRTAKPRSKLKKTKRAQL